MTKTHFTIYGILCAVILFMAIRHGKIKEELLSTGQILSEKTKELNYRKTENGKLVLEVASAEASLKFIKNHYAKEIAGLRTEMEMSKKDIRNLKSFFKSELDAHAFGSTVTNNHYFYDSLKKDSVLARTANYKDGYFDAQVIVLPDSTAWKLNYQDTITVAGFTKKNWIFSNEQYFVNSMLSNPNAKLINAKSFQVKEFKDKRFSFGPGVLFDPFTMTFRVGIGLQYSLVKF